MEGSKVTHHTVVELLFVRVNGLSMLTKVIESRELFGTVAREGAFSCMFSNRASQEQKKKKKEKKRGYVPDVPSEMLAPGKDHTTFAITPTLKSFCGGLTVSFERGLLF